MKNKLLPTIVSAREKRPSESKKFLAWFISEITWKAIIVVALILWKGDLTVTGSGAWWFLITIVVTAGFIGIGFILGQAALDKYVRVAEIAADTVHDKLAGNPMPKDESTTDPPTDPKVTS